MIDDKILDQVIPVPDLTELEDQRIQELSDAGFTITNFHSGGVFHTLLMIVLRIQIELLELCRTVLNQMFVSHASGAWLDLKTQILHLLYSRVEYLEPLCCFTFIEVLATIFPPYFANGAPIRVSNSLDSSSVFAVVTKQMSIPRTLSILS